MTGKAFIILLGALAVDGDTLSAGGQAVRLWGIDAPEMDRRAGRRAARHMRQLIEGAELTCRIKDVDRYDRIVAQCFNPQGQDLACLMVGAGHAQDWPRFSGGYYEVCKPD
jgi:endonuclease YncB( thermonuclease family)